MVDGTASEDVETLMAEIRRIQRSLTELQKQVIAGEIEPQKYMQTEQARVAEIHRLEERLAELMDDPTVNPRHQ